jgi:cardiolipin synthase
MSLAELPVSHRRPLPQAQTATVDLLAGGHAAFARILERIEQAERSIAMRCFEWRDDDTGKLVGEALLAAAERGVKVTILKDRVGACYELLEGSKQSFFHKRIGLAPRLQTWFLMTVYGRWGTQRQHPSALADALVAHPNVTVVRDGKRFDHAKLYVFDDEAVILGGMGIGDDFRHHNVDFMVEVSGGRAAERLAERYEGRALFDARRPYDYLLHSFRGSARSGGSLADDRLGLIASARERLTIAMAYFGDTVCTDALVNAVRRGVQVTVLTAARANIIGDLNLWTCAQLLRRTRSADNLRIVLHPRMVHGKAIVGDGAWVDIGSTNFTPPSHGGYEEVDLYSRDAAFARQVEQAIEREVQAGTRATLPIRYRRAYVAAERMLCSVHGRSKTSKFVE